MSAQPSFDLPRPVGFDPALGQARDRDGRRPPRGRTAGATLPAPAARSRLSNLRPGGRAIRLAGLGLWLVTMAMGCAGRSTSFTRPHRPANGRPATCPEGAVDPFGDGTPGPYDARCSYADTPGAGMVRVRGRVTAPSVDATPGRGVEGVTVVLAERAQPEPSASTTGGRAPTLGRTLAKTRSDAQGSFSFGVAVPDGEYWLAVEAADASPVPLTIVGGNAPDSTTLTVPAPAAH